jgi:hypothetical protein
MIMSTSVITTAPAAKVTMSLFPCFIAVMKMKASTNCIANITKNLIPLPIFPPFLFVSFLFFNQLAMD